MPGSPASQPIKNGLRGVIARLLPPDSRAGQVTRRSAIAIEDALRSAAMPLLLVGDSMAILRAWHHPGPGIGKKPQQRKIVMLVVSQLHLDPRVRQEAQALAAAGFDIVVMWPELVKQVGRPIDWGPGITFERLAPKTGRFAYRFPGFLGVDMLASALTHAPFAFHAHDLTTTLVALAAAQRTGAYAVCDFHEWFSEHVTWSNRAHDYVPLSGRQRAANKWMERLAFHEASAIVTVCESIARDMEHEFGDGSPKIHVVRNIAAEPAVPAKVYPSLRQELALDDGQFLLLYQGGIGPARALEEVIAALAQVPECVLAIRGPSIEAYAAHYRAVAAQNGVQPQRLVLLPPVPSTDVVAACNGADAGLYTASAMCKSFVYALPNKVFEYMKAGLPVLTADYPEVRAAVVETGAGLSFDADRPASIARAIRAMMDREQREAMRARLPAVLASLNAYDEWEKVVEIYLNLERRGAHTAVGRHQATAAHQPQKVAQ